MAAIKKWSIDKLDSLNLMMWKFQIKHLLLVKDLTDGTEVLHKIPCQNSSKWTSIKYIEGMHSLL